MFSTGLWSWNEPNGPNLPSHGNDKVKQPRVVEVNARDLVWSVVFLDEKGVVSTGKEGKIRRWQIEDGKELGPPMDVGASVMDLAVSKDGRLIVGGSNNGEVSVWSPERRSKLTGFKGHGHWVRAIDVSPNGTRIATGSDDKTASVWSLSTGERLLGPIKHDDWVVGVKFSPSGRLFATATWARDAVRIYNVEDGDLVAEFPVQVYSAVNQSIAWAHDDDQLFALSRGGYVHCLDVSTRTTLSQWLIHSSNDVRCLVVSRNNTFVATSASSLVSFWDTTTHEQIGSVVEFTHDIWSMAISATDIVVGGDVKITFRGLSDMLPSPYLDNVPRERKMKSIESEKVDFGAAPEPLVDSPNKRMACLEKTVHDLRIQLAESQRNAKQESENLIESHRAQEATSHVKITHLEGIIEQLRAQLVECQQKAHQGMHDLVQIMEQRHKCEVLCAEGRVVDATVPLLAIENIAIENPEVNEFIVDWLRRFAHQCVATLESIGDKASTNKEQDEAIAAYSAALCLSASAPINVLSKWTRIAFACRPVSEALIAAAKFKLPKFVIYRVICDMLEEDGRIKEAIECFQQMQNELQRGPITDDVRGQWEFDFRRRGGERLVKLGDTAMDSKNYHMAIQQFSDALTLDVTNQRNVHLKRSRAREIMGLWDDVLLDANKVIHLDPSSHEGYERKYTALHSMQRYGQAFEAFELMLIRLEQSADPFVQKLRHNYVDATPAIRKVVQQTIRSIPRVLVDTTTGRLYDKIQQAAAFEELPIYDELRSSMTTRLDAARIRKEVLKFYRYVMFSHRWQPNEPTFQQVEHISIFNLPISPANTKLENFCKLVRALHFRWAWSDTCCVNQLDKGVQQESLVAMFRWYRSSSLTVVHLLGVLSESQEFGCLWKSIWNTRGWTYQEYVASQVVQFYTEDWKPYLGLDVFNHKESPVILSEMEQAMKLDREKLSTLQPGLDRVREKLYLASMRQTTREEDIAYSLFGIFNVAIPIIYGEGNHAVGRLLEHILTRSDSVSLLAWTGRSGSHHSYLPADLTVYNQIIPPHIPPPIETTKRHDMVAALRASADLSLVTALYERLHNLPPLSLVAGRLRLPGIVFSLDDLYLSDSDSDFHVYCATTPMLGDVEIQTTDNLSGMEGLLLIHPWISPLLDQDFSRGAALYDLVTRALRLVVRLRQPFGALLLAPLGRVQFKRVATDSLIMVRVREETSLIELLDGVRTVDVQ